MLTETISASGLEDILQKVVEGERLDFSDGVRLYQAEDLNVVGYLANIVREQKNGSIAYYIRNQHINYTNICNKLCKFCSFYVTPRDERGYVLEPEVIRARVREFRDYPIREIHMVGGINPKLPYEYYLDIVRAVRDERPQAHVKAFTMIELAQLERVAKKPLEEVLTDLKKAMTL